MPKYNFVFSGKVIPIEAPKNVNSNEGLLVGDLFGVIGNTAVQGESTELYLEGVYRLPKSQDAIDLGQKVYWDEKESLVTAQAQGNRLIGASTQAVKELDPLVEIKLIGGVIP